MSRKHRQSFAAVALVAGIALAACNQAPAAQPSTGSASAAPAGGGTQHEAQLGRNVRLPRMLVTKSPTCGCCHLWVEHMRKAGFQIEVRDVDDINLVKQRVGVPYGKGSCHTAEVNGYFIEGHVPAADVKRLLAEQPDAKGLVVPGMPAGSPGMEMPDGRLQPYVGELGAEYGSTSEFARHGE